MTRDELTAVFQDVSQQLQSEDFMNTLLESFRKECMPDSSGTPSREDMIAVAIAAMNDYLQKFLFEVLSRALCKD